MTAAEIVARARISDVWTALGGQAPRFHRAPAFWRDTRDPNVSLNDPKGTWYDHARGEGGGVLDLIERARGGTRQQAAEWLAGYLGLELDRSELTPAERRNYARAAALAPALARAASLWWRGRRAELEDSKRQLMEVDLLDFDLLAAAARELYRLGNMSAESIVRAYLAAAKDDPIGTAAIVETAAAWESAAGELAGLLIDGIAAAQGAHNAD